MLLLQLKITVKKLLSTGKTLLRGKIYFPTGCVLMIVLSMWNIIIVGEGALGCLCQSSNVE
jgi:hypothetical protein